MPLLRLQYSIKGAPGVIRNWMSNINSFEYYGLWEEINNPDFKSVKFHGIKTTEAIKETIVPTVTEKQKKYVYAEEADLLNVALFGMTAKEWRERNPDLAKDGNIRDYTDLLHLIVLNNMENINAQLIKSGLPQSERLTQLNEIAKSQMKLLLNNRSIEELLKLEK